MFFIPEGFWHRVESTAQCVAINIWFDHKGTSTSAMCTKTNQHILPYQAREMVRQYIDANIEKVNESRANRGFGKILQLHGLRGFRGFDRHPGTIMNLFEAMNYGQIIPKKRKKREIQSGLDIIQHHASNVISTTCEEELSPNRRVRSLRILVLPYAINYLGMMISYFITMMQPSESGEDGERDRKAIISLFDRLPATNTTVKKQIFSELIQSFTSEAYYYMSVAWEKHKPVKEAEESFMSVFSRCRGDEARRYFTAEVAAFRNESAQKLILGDLMLLNPQQEQA